MQYLFNGKVFLTLIIFLFLVSCYFWDRPFGEAAEIEPAIFGQPGQHHGHQHAQHQEDQTNTEVGSCGTEEMVSDSNCDAVHVFGLWVCVCLCLHASWHTDDGAAVAVSRQLIVEDDEEHGEAEHQSDLERVAFAASQRQSEADRVGQDDQNTGQQ